MLFWIPLMLGLVGSVQGQEPAEQPPQEDQGFKIGVDVNQVYLSVTARQRDGGFARDLRREDFRVLEDGVEQEIVNFTQEAVPVRVVLLIDASGSTRHSQNSIRRAALQFAKSLSSEVGPDGNPLPTIGDDRVAIITFNDEPALILDWTNSVERIETALESVYAKGPTRLNDALFVTFDDLLRDVPGKKAVILLTDGIDNSSTVSFDEAVDLAVRSEAIVYVASKVDDVWAEAIAARAQGVRLPSQYSNEGIVQIKRSLQRLANLTGGRVLESQAFNSLSDVYEAVADELKNQYYMSYVPSNIMRDGRWRTIELQVRRLGVVANTRPGYFAPGS